MIYALEGLRGIAALVVAMLHGWDSALTDHLSSGWLCVDLFFVISGFVMSHVYRDQLSEPRQVASFAIKRIGRLYPLHLVTLLAVLALETLRQLVKPIAWLVGHATNPMRFDFADRWSVLANVFMAQGLRLPGLREYNAPSWSISLEMWAYAVFALSIFAVRGKARPAAWAAISFAGLLLWAAADGKGNAVDAVAFRCAHGFFLGALLPLIFARLRPSAAAISVLQVVGAIASLAVFVAVGQFDRVKLAAPLCFATLVLGVSFDHGPVAKVLRWRPLQTLGRLSYSVYMTHALVLLLLDPVGDAIAEPFRSAAKAGYVLLVLLLSAGTYRWIEAPWRARFSAYAARFAERHTCGTGFRSASGTIP